MLQPLRPFQPKFKLSFPYAHYMSIRGCTMEWKKHEAARLRRSASARALSFNECPVDFEFLVYKLLQILRADEKLAFGCTAEIIYCHAENLVVFGGDHELCKETLDFYRRELAVWSRKSFDGFKKPPAKVMKSAFVREKYYRMVNFVERCLRRYVLDDWSISIRDSDQANQPPSKPIPVVMKKCIIRSLFEDIGLPRDVFVHFFEALPAKNI